MFGLLPALDAFSQSILLIACVLPTPCPSSGQTTDRGWRPGARGREALSKTPQHVISGLKWAGEPRRAWSRRQSPRRPLVRATPSSCLRPSCRPNMLQTTGRAGLLPARVFVRMATSTSRTPASSMRSNVNAVCCPQDGRGNRGWRSSSNGA